MQAEMLVQPDWLMPEVLAAPLTGGYRGIRGFSPLQPVSFNAST